MISSSFHSPTATSPASPLHGRSSATFFPPCGSPICAICGIRCRSISGSKAWDSTPRSWWSACSAVSTGGATVSNGCRHSRVSARSRLQSSPEKIAMTLAWPKPRPCRTTSSTHCCAFSARAGRGIWDPCFGGSRIMQARTSMCPSRVRCRAWPDTSRAKAPSILIGLSGSVGAIGRASRSCSIARCCWRPTRRRSMRSVER